MTRVFLAAMAALWIGLMGFEGAGQAQAQTLEQDNDNSFWIQLEANSTIDLSQAAARRYASAIQNVQGFRLRSGWYAVAVGPFSRDVAAQELARLNSLGLVPRDAYVDTGDRYGARYFPIGADATAQVPTLLGPVTEVLEGTVDEEVDEVIDQVTLAPAPEAEATAEPEAEVGVQQTAQLDAVPTPQIVREETRDEALRAERLLDRTEREALQIALAWFDFYRAGIDGDFGPGTRNAMAAWQDAQGFEATGILTTRQRAILLNSYQGQLASVGLQTVRDEAAGIEMQMPMARVAFARYEPPFVQYDNTDGSGVRVLLISQNGTRATLHGLYDVMQTLEIVPLEGARSKNRDDFVLTGQNDQLHSYTYAALSGGMVKGFTMTWRPEEDALMAKIVGEMRASFRAIGTTALDETLGQPDEEQRIDLMAGLEIRQPIKARSGVYVDPRGSVLTSAEAVEGCARVTLGGVYDADVVLTDAASGIALLRPQTAQAPLAVAQFQTGTPRLRSPIAVAGFPFEGSLGGPTLSFGTLEDLRGLNGEETLARLDVSVRDGDSGGPVLDASGAVVGVLMARGADGATVLPEDVHFATRTPAISSALVGAPVQLRTVDTGESLAPEDLTVLAADMTVLVSCWN